MHGRRRRLWTSLALAGCTLALAGCSVREFAVRQLGKSLAGGGGAFAAEDDLVLAGDAIPFSLKLVESLLLQVPDDPNLLLAAASGFTQYAYGWVQQPADLVEADDFERAAAERARAARLYLRAHSYARRLLEATLPEFATAFPTDPQRALAGARAEHVPALYWAAASLGGAISLSKQNPELIARVGEISHLIDAAARLDPAWQQGAIPAFLVTFELARPGGTDPVGKSRAAYAEALRHAGGRNPGAELAFAEGVLLREQQRAEFERLLQGIIATDPDADPDQRLALRLHQQRATWLLGRLDELFLE